MEVPGGVLGAGEGPFLLVAPAVLAHDEDANGSLVHDPGVLALQPVAEPALLDLHEVDLGFRAEVEVAGPAALGKGVADVAPGADEQALLAARVGAAEGVDAFEAGEGALQEDVVPGAEVEHGHVDGVEAAADVDLVPEGAVVGVVEVVAEVGSAVLHALDPVGEGDVGVALGGEGLREEAVLLGRVEVGLEGVHLLAGEAIALQGVAALEEGVGDHPAVLEGAAGVARPALAVIGGSGDGRHRLQMGRGVGGELVLVGAQVGLAEGSDIAVAPGLLGEPLDGVVAVGALVQVGGVVALGAEASAAVLGDVGVAEGQPEVDAGAFAAGGPPVGGTRQEGGEGAGTGGAVDVALKTDTVAHRDHDVLFDGHVHSKHLGHGSPPLRNGGRVHDGRRCLRGQPSAAAPSMKSSGVAMNLRRHSSEQK